MNIPRMSYPQYRKARRLTHECCNYCNGNCLLLDDGEECVCVFGLGRFQLPKLLLQLRDLALGFLNILFNALQFVHCHSQKLLSGV